MWGSYNPEDIRTCAKSTPACRASYVERSPDSATQSQSESAGMSMATAHSSEESDVVINTPESVTIDMAPYSTGTPFKRNVQNIQDQCQTLDFSKELVGNGKQGTPGAGLGMDSGFGGLRGTESLFLSDLAGADKENRADGIGTPAMAALLASDAPEDDWQPF